MNFLLDNFTSVIKNSLEFSGRANRSEYWWFIVVNVAIALGLQMIDFVIGIPVLSIVFMLAMLLPAVAVSIRRLHDSERSGWWMLVGLVPILGAFAVFALMVIPGTEGENRYGKKPVTQSPFGQSVAAPASQ
jgi:uncharacterized membrane protein YhaH (DUF805 family)